MDGQDLTTAEFVLGEFAEAQLRYYPDEDRLERYRHWWHQGLENGGTALGFNRRSTGRQAGLSRSKLSEEDVRSIRSSSEPLKDLAERYGVSKATVSRVRNRKRRAEVT